MEIVDDAALKLSSGLSQSNKELIPFTFKATFLYLIYIYLIFGTHSFDTKCHYISYIYIIRLFVRITFIHPRRRTYATSIIDKRSSTERRLLPLYPLVHVAINISQTRGFLINDFGCRVLERRRNSRPARCAANKVNPRARCCVRRNSRALREY